MTTPSIRRRLLAWLLGALAVGAVLVGLMTYALTLDEMNEEFDEELKQVALTVLSHADVVARPAPYRPSPDDLEGYVFFTQVWSLRGERMSTSDAAVDIPFIAKEGYSTLATASGRWRIYTDRSESHFIQAAQLVRVRERFAAEVALKALIPGVVGAPLVAALLGVALRRGLSPLTTAAHDVRDRSATSLMPISTERTPRELQPLVRAINALMERLATALESQKRLVDETAHQLRTPLTALRLQVEAIASAGDEAARRAAFTDALGGIERSTRVVEQLLTLARARPDAAAESRPVHVGELARESVAAFAAMAQRRGIDLGADVQDDGALTVSGRASQLRVMVDNLVDNALRYTPPGGRVDVQVKALQARREVELAVVDSGPGIPPEERESVFARFYRGSAADAAGGVGAGLGLAIVKASAEGHGARIGLADGFLRGQEGTGLRIAVFMRQSGGEGVADDTAEKPPASPEEDKPAMAR
jgi:two-component system OmpR family sensor kinase